MLIKSDSITGKEKINDLSNPIEALAQFYFAFNNKDITIMSNNWLQSEEISMDNPLGGIKRGWDEIKSVYEKIFNGPGKVQVEFYDYSINKTDAMFVAVGRERGDLIMDTQTIKLNIRTSRVFKKFQNVWKQVHHHGSIDNPQLLMKYQSAILGKKKISIKK